MDLTRMIANKTYLISFQGATQEHYGIYVKEVIDGGPAAQVVIFFIK